MYQGCRLHIHHCLKTHQGVHSEVGKVNPFDPEYKEAMGLTLPGVPAGTTGTSTEELLRQILINTNQAFLALVHGMRSLQATAAKGIAIKPANTAVDRDGRAVAARKYDPNKPKRDLSEIECFICHELGHYASSCPNNLVPPTVSAGALLPQQDPSQSTASESGIEYATSRCLLVDDSNPVIAGSYKVRWKPKEANDPTEASRGQESYSTQGTYRLQPTYATATHSRSD